LHNFVQFLVITFHRYCHVSTPKNILNIFKNFRQYLAKDALKFSFHGDENNRMDDIHSPFVRCFRDFIFLGFSTMMILLIEQDPAKCGTECWHDACKRLFRR